MLRRREAVRASKVCARIVDTGNFARKELEIARAVRGEKEFSQTIFVAKGLQASVVGRRDRIRRCQIGWCAASVMWAEPGRN
jgi:hypothetical protein